MWHFSHKLWTKVSYITILHSKAVKSITSMCPKRDKRLVGEFVMSPTKTYNSQMSIKGTRDFRESIKNKKCIVFFLQPIIKLQF